MRNVGLLMAFMLMIWGCQDDDKTFDVAVSDVGITFRQVGGGAVMYYDIPNNSEIFSIRAVYENDFNEQVLKQGTYLGDSIVLDGFREAKTDVPVWISLQNEHNEESAPVQYLFDTQASASYAFFDHAEVLPYWGGFMLIYESPDFVDGFANVFYMGTNPMTQELDTLLLQTFQIEKGRDTIFYPLEQKRDKNTVIIKTEDSKGHLVRQNIWTDVLSYNVEKLDPTNFEILDPENIIKDDDTYCFGWEYLFDGDTKGTRRYQEDFTIDKDYTFVMGPYAVGKSIILDIKEQKTIGSMRFYAMLYTDKWWGNGWEGYMYANRLPNEITIMGSNNKDDDNSWVQIGHYEESSVLSVDSWAYAANDYQNIISDYETLETTEPCYVEVPFHISEEKYRYYKIIINSIFTVEGFNINRYEDVSFHELEVYAKID